MKLKKLVTLAIALVLTTTQALAASPADLLKELKTEKSFVLDSLTGIRGNDAGKHPVWKQSKKQRIFYVTDCEGKCNTERAEILSTLKKFAKDYNQALGREYIIVDSHITSGGSNHHTRFKLHQKKRIYNGRFRGGYKCKWNSNNNIVVNYCQIQLALKASIIKRVNYRAVQFAMKTLGIFHTQKLDYRYCLVYDPSSLNDTEYEALTKHRFTKGYQGLCEIEKQTIAFFDKYIKSAMRKSQVAKAFDKHWVSDTTLALDKIDPNWREKKAPKKAITKKTFSQQSGNR